MKTIQLEIEDKSLDMFISLINSFKDGVIKKFTVKESSDFIGAKFYFHEAYKNIDKTKLVPFDYELDELDDYLDSIE